MISQSGKNFIKNAFLIFSIRVIGAALTFVSTLVFAKILGPERFGIFSLLLTLVTIVSVFVRMGLDNVVLKQVSANLTSQPELSNGYLLSSIRWILLSGGLLTIIIYLFSKFIAYDIFSKPVLEDPLKYFSFYIIPFSLVIIFSAAFKSFERPIFANLIQTIFVPLSVLITVALFWFFEVIELEYIITALILGAILGNLIYLYFWDTKYKTKIVKYLTFSSLLKEGFPMLLISSGALVMAWSDIIMLGIFATNNEIGAYAAASRTVMVTSLVLIAINSITAPKYARYYRENKIESIKRLAQASSLILLITVSIPIGLIFLYSQEIMQLFGQGYALGAKVLVILAIGQFVNVSFGSVGYLLSMTGREEKLRDIMFISAIVNIILSYIGIKFFGFIGVAYATAFSVVLWNTLALVEVKKYLGFWTFNIMYLFKRKTNESV
jgi:O-antigen/teichoic acid export membrane protein